MNVVAKKLLSEKEAKAILGRKAKESDYDKLIKEDCVVKDENGDTLFAFVKNALPNNLIKEAYPSLQKAAGYTNNRGTATYKGSMKAKVLKDGTLSNTKRSEIDVRSGIVGYFDRYPRIPYCRTCAWTEKNPEKWATILPVIHKVNSYFKEKCPKEYYYQKEAVNNASQDFIIEGTAFSTATINCNWQSAYHRDKNNIEGGMAGMAVVGAGKYSGAYLCFPEYRIAVSIESSDIIVMNNTHLVHGNTSFHGKHGEYERISVVCYFRNGIQKCGTRDYELERAKKYGAKINENIEYAV